MKDIWFSLNALHCDAARRGMYELATAYLESCVRMGLEIISDHERNRDLGDMIK